MNLAGCVHGCARACVHACVCVCVNIFLKEVTNFEKRYMAGVEAGRGWERKDVNIEVVYEVLKRKV